MILILFILYINYGMNGNIVGMRELGYKESLVIPTDQDEPLLLIAGRKYLDWDCLKKYIARNYIDLYGDRSCTKLQCQTMPESMNTASRSPFILKVLSAPISIITAPLSVIVSGIKIAVSAVKDHKTQVDQNTNSFQPVSNTIDDEETYSSVFHLLK